MLDNFLLNAISIHLFYLDVNWSMNIKISFRDVFFFLSGCLLLTYTILIRTKLRIWILNIIWIWIFLRRQIITIINIIGHDSIFCVRWVHRFNDSNELRGIELIVALVVHLLSEMIKTNNRMKVILFLFALQLFIIVRTVISSNSSHGGLHGYHLAIAS